MAAERRFYSLFSLVVMSDETLGPWVWNLVWVAS